MIEVELPDGTIAEFPDGTPHATIEAALYRSALPPRHESQSRRFHPRDRVASAAATRTHSR